MGGRAFRSQGWVQKSSLPLRELHAKSQTLTSHSILWIPVHYPPRCHDGSCSLIPKGSLSPFPTLWSSLLASEADADMAD